jgi:hypothetical protein
VIDVFNWPCIASFENFSRTLRIQSALGSALIVCDHRGDADETALVSCPSRSLENGVPCVLTDLRQRGVSIIAGKRTIKRVNRSPREDRMERKLDDDGSSRSESIFSKRHHLL